MISLTDNPLQLPAPCVQVSCCFDSAAYDSSRGQQFGVVLPERLSTAVTKRKAEFVAGRYCVQLALKRMGEDSGQAIGISEKRAPLWPEGLIGSITHSKGFASAALASAQWIRGIGIDSERLIAEKTANNVASHILIPTETYEKNCGLVSSARQYLTLIFSAKESIFKCLFPLVEQYFDFRDAEISLNPQDPGKFRFRLRKHLTGEFRDGYIGAGQYTLAGNFVHTAVVMTER